jgi:N-acetylglutamate synthase
MNDNISLDSINIRRFTIDDYDAVISLWLECELPLKTKGRDHIDKIRKEITRDTAHFLVAEIEIDGKKNIIGTVLATHDGRKGWINRLAVSPDFQHKGLAQRLLKEAENALHSMDIEIIACFIEDYNTHSMNFFKKAGYIHHPDFYYFTKRKHPDV